MKIMRLFLVIVAIINLSGDTALGCDQIRETIYDEVSVFVYPRIFCCACLKCSPAIGAGLGGCIVSAGIYLKYSAVTAPLPFITMFSSGIIGFGLGLSVTYAATKMYESCVLRLQHRQNSDDPA